jgi:hypothetical protein
MINEKDFIKLMGITAEKFSIKPEKISKHSHKSEVAKARNLVAFLGKAYLNFSYVDIGKIIKRHPSSVNAAAEKARDAISADVEYRDISMEIIKDYFQTCAIPGKNKCFVFPKNMEQPILNGLHHGIVSCYVIDEITLMKIGKASMEVSDGKVNVSLCFDSAFVFAYDVGNIVPSYRVTSYSEQNKADSVSVTCFFYKSNY